MWKTEKKKKPGWRQTWTKWPIAVLSNGNSEIFPNHITLRNNFCYWCHSCKCNRVDWRFVHYPDEMGTSQTSFASSFNKKKHKTGSSLVMAWHLFGAKPLPELMVPYCQQDLQEHNLVKFKSKYKTFLASKCSWKSRLGISSHFVQTIMR